MIRLRTRIQKRAQDVTRMHPEQLCIRKAAYAAITADRLLVGAGLESAKVLLKCSSS